MKNPLLFTSIFILIFSACQNPKEKSAEEKTGHNFHLFFLGGQSNMDGYGFNSEIPEGLEKPSPDVYIFHSTPQNDSIPVDGKGLWEVLRPGHGASFSTDGKSNNLSNRFGPELSFGKRMSELMPGKKIAIIKYAKGGSSIALHASPWGTWDPDFNDVNGVNQFDHFLATMRNALSVEDINGDGKKDKLIPEGIAWMQGESDADDTEEIAQKYEGNLKRLMDLIRTSMLVDDLPVVISRITDSGMDEDGVLMDHIEIVQQAQADYVRKDGHAAFIQTTADCDFLEDGWHYTSDCYIRMGNEMAEELYKLGKNKN